MIAITLLALGDPLGARQGFGIAPGFLMYRGQLRLHRVVAHMFFAERVEHLVGLVKLASGVQQLRTGNAQGQVVGQ